MKNNNVKRLESKFSKIGCLLLLVFNVFISFAQGCPNVPISETDETQRFSVYGKNIEDDLGESVSNLGDVNGDGISDIITGAPGVDNGTILDVGEAYVVFGATGITTSSIDFNNLDGTNGFTVRGVSPSDKIGIDVSSAGDINDDGINDILIGSSGKAIIIFGTSRGFSPVYTVTDINGSNGILLEDTLLGGQFGETLSNTADVNNDNVDDVIIGSPNSIGNAYVFYGSSTIGNTDAASLNGSNGFKIEGFSQRSSGNGLNVSNAGDINGDGLGDLIMGYPNYDEGSEISAGRVAVVFGSKTGFLSVFSLSSLNGSNGFFITENVAYARLGANVAEAKKINGDEFDDLAVTSYYKAYVIYGKGTPFVSSVDISDIDVTDKFVFEAGWYQSTDILSGIDGLSDINNDGITDLIISTESGYSKNGAIYIIYGSRSLTTTMHSLDLIGTNGYSIFDNVRYSREGFGASVSEAGDFNNDGTFDFIVGARNSLSHIYNKSGQTHVFFGNELDVIDNIAPTISCPSGTQELYANSSLPNYISLLPSVNDNCTYNTDMVYTQTPAEGTLFTSNTSVEITVTDRSGNTSSCSFMVTLKTTTAEIDCATTNFSVDNLNGTNGLVIYGEDSNSYAGYDVNTAGDVNGDGIDDFIVLARGDTVNFTGPYDAHHIDVSGGVYIIFGVSSGFPPNIDLGYLNGINGFKINNDNLPHSRTSSDNNFFKADIAGDINKDGFDDIILSNTHREGRAGHIYIIFGKNGGFSANFDLATLNGINGFTIIGTGRNGSAGIDLDNLGDVNGDSIDDIIVTNGTYSGYSESGKSFVIYGATSGFPIELNLTTIDGTNGFMITTDGSTPENIGGSVAGVGDVNGDNINDIAIGGSKDRKFVIFGKPSGTTFPSTFNVEDLDGTNGFAVEHSTSTFNLYVNNANDVNKDGYNDIIFGNQYVLFGNDAFPDVFDLNDLDGTNGFSLSNAGRVFNSVGDFNKDSYDDLIYGNYRSQYIIYGKENWEESISINSSTSGCLLEISLLNNNYLGSGSYAGDVNNDGIDDLILGQYNTNNYDYKVNADPGFAYVIFGKDMPDTEAPVISCPVNQVLVSGSLLPDYTSLATVTDNCDSCIVITQAPVAGSTYTPGMTVTLTATDRKGNSVNCSFIVDENIDKEDPTASNPSPIVEQCNAPTADITVVTDEADNSGITPTVAFVSDVSDGNSNPEIITRTYSVTDAAGNSINVIQTITVNDTVNPTASNPTAINVSCAGDIPTADISVVTDEADNCTGIITVAFVSDVSDGNNNPEIITRTYSVTDVAGNSINVIQTITVNDTVNPTASNPTAINVSCAGDIPTADISVVTDEADNCTGIITVVFVSDVSDGNNNPEIITRTYSVTDVAGNSINVIQTITVNDTVNPTASNPTAINVSCAGDIPTADISVVTDEADNCTGIITVAFVSDVSDGNNNPEIITRTYSVTDVAGNSINVVQTITVNDTVNPTASNPTAINVSCAGDIPTADISVVTDEADNCMGIITVAFVSDVSDGNNNPEIITRTYSVTDVAGNSINVVQTITVNDIIDPVITCPSNITQKVDSDLLTAIVTYTIPVATDNCTDVIINQTVGLLSGAEFPIGINTISFEATDTAGNTATCSFNITVEAEDLLVCTVDAGTDLDITEGDEVALNAVTSGTGLIEWSPSTGLSSTMIANPIATPIVTTTYTIRFTNTQGCIAEDTVTVFVTTPLEKDETKYGFSPDGDGINEYWEIDGIENYPENIVLIYNRWGDLVFETTGYNNTSKVFRGIANRKRNLGADKLPEGTYLFHIKIKGSHNLKKEKGFLILKR